MNQSIQPQQPAQPAPTEKAAASKSSKTWLWILGGCLTIIILSLLVMGGVAWWSAKKVKKVIQENQPRWEEMQKNAEQWQQQSDNWQKEMEKAQEEIQKNLPNHSVSQ